MVLREEEAIKLESTDISTLKAYSTLFEMAMRYQDVSFRTWRCPPGAKSQPATAHCYDTVDVYEFNCYWVVPIYRVLGAMNFASRSSVGKYRYRRYGCAADVLVYETPSVCQHTALNRLPSSGIND